ncbi:aromatic ring-hydroxylating dioxygenase subunit alpha [Halioglobus sp. HI00S01]|uniref:aromatic ring-hydroxylating oxygenase subunit alpha n=1 Tax=Halioglobus sp. HI00S01 TaxID=1822214 RepID=UPI000825FC9A|nr:aromatic ring-hydroxylating dioxygenase subunit alpha [Halioglobus sp. HI00S01]
MSNMSTFQEGYSGLTEGRESLPSTWYRDADHYQRELRAIWYRQWMYVDRVDSLPDPGNYRIVQIGDQSIIVLRGNDGVFRAFHNTCRHRGAELLSEPYGNLPGNIACPYHGWSYDHCGDLLRAPSNFRQTDFEEEALGLYPVAIEVWRGFLFINLRPDAQPLTEGMDCGGQALANWPLEGVVVGHEYREEIACNWKLFWENFSECLHCPGIHPELSDLVPLYKRRMMEVQDDPLWQQHQAEGNPRYRPGLREGSATWSADGQPCDTPFSGLSPEDLARGHTYEVSWPTAFMVGHVDYVRIVWLRPLSPVKTELCAQWLFRPETLEIPHFNPAEFAHYAEMVLGQDARAAEMNQRGLSSIAHQTGRLMAEEYEVHAFQEWVRAQLAQAEESL